MNEIASYEELQQRVASLEQEIRDQKYIYEALKKELKNEITRRQILIEQSRDGIVVIDQNGKVYESNRKFADMLGYPANEMNQLHIWDWDARWTREQILDMLDKVDPAGDHFETRHRRKDGVCYDVEISTNGATFEGRKLIFCVCRDVTKRKAAEAALKDSEERFRRLFEELPVAIQGYRPDGTVHYWNKASVDTYQYTKEEAIGKNLIDLIIPPEMRDMVAEAIRHGAETGEMPHQAELMLMRKDESLVPVLSSHAAIQRESKETELFCIDLDLTELKQLQADLQQAHKMEAIGTMTGGIAHDFNNILGIILGNCELALEDTHASHPASVCLEEIMTAGLRAKEIVQQLMTYCLKTSQEKKPFSLVPLLNDIIKLIRSTIPTTIEIRPYMEAEDDTILSEPTLIYQMMIGLCSNALHAMEETGGAIIIYVDNVHSEKVSQQGRSKLPAGKYVRLRVEDTGSGIPADVIDRIFDPYFTTKEVGKGSGMGLTVVRGIVNKHDGEISVHSRPGSGTTFTVLLPLTEASPDFEKKSEGTMALAKGTILYVDDEQAIVSAGVKTLERLGFEVIAATRPTEVLERLEKDPKCCDLIISDMSMPHMSGLELAQKIRSIDTRIPIIICTGFNEQLTAEKAKTMGVNEILMKPVLKTEIVGVVRRLLAKQIG